jgi:hypothetical protein
VRVKQVENENELNQNDGGALRKQLEDALKKNKEMSDRLAAVEARERTSTVEKTLSEKGLNPKLARFVSAEDGSDPARLDTWIKENAELFGAGTAAEAQAPAQPSVDAAAQNAFTQIQKVSENGAHAVTDLAAVKAQMLAAKNQTEFDAVMAQYRIS